MIRHAGRAFTLIEIMVVIVVLAIAAAAIVPNMAGSLATTRLEDAARQVADLMDYAGNAARATGRVHGLVFEPDGRRFTLVREVPPPPEAGLGQPPTLEAIKLPGPLARELPESIVLASVAVFERDLIGGEEDQVRILFFPDGTTEFATLYLTDPHGDERYVSLNGLSGTVEIESRADYLEVPEGNS